MYAIERHKLFKVHIFFNEAGMAVWDPRYFIGKDCGDVTSNMLYRKSTISPNAQH